MTKTIIIDTSEKLQKTKRKLEPIEFHKLLNVKGNIVGEEDTMNPSEFFIVELISLNYSDDFDIMFAHNGNRSEGCLFLGKWNDGVVE